MSANDAVFVVTIAWAMPKSQVAGRIVEWQHLYRWLVFYGDFDHVGEITRDEVVTKELLWYALNQRGELYSVLTDALKAANLLAVQQVSTEYGFQHYGPLKYVEPS
jgi:hypothetical protein